MRIVIPTTGSRGDVQPYLALGVGLRAAGHAVRMATHADFANFVRERGLDFYPITGSSRQMHALGAGSDMIHSGGKTLPFLRHFARMREPLLSELMAHCDQACADADLILAAPTAFGVAYSVAEKRRLPLVPSYYIPMTPTRALPSCLGPEPPAWLPGRGLFNLLSHFFVGGYLWNLLRPASNRARAEVLGLPPLPPWGPPLRFFRDFPTLHGYSPLVVPRPADVGVHHVVTGYWFLNTAPGWQPPPKLLDFLASGAPPICIGFGSMHSRDAAQITELVVRALTHCRQRGILLTGWGGLSAALRSDDMFVTETLPHDWLFPRSAAVVHHGGAGTTAAALRAGVPNIVVPFMADQPFWGRRVQRLGVGPAPIPFAELTVQRLADAMQQAIENADIRRSAAWLGARLREEDGIGRAVAVLHEYAPVLERQWDSRAESRRGGVTYRPRVRPLLLPQGATQAG